MTTTAGAVEMARRIAANMPGLNALQRCAFLDGEWDNAPTVQAALAAIIETQTDIVAWLRTEWRMLPEALDFADMIERGTHLKGPKP